MHPRQRSALQLNRRVKFEQTPPNFEDFAPECLESAHAGTLLQAPSPAAGGNQPESRKRPSGSKPSDDIKTPKNARVTPSPLSYQKSHAGGKFMSFKPTRRGNLFYQLENLNFCNPLDRS